MCRQLNPRIDYVLLCFTANRIEPDGQRPKVLIHGKACRKTANPKCAYDTSDTRSGIEVRKLCGCAASAARADTRVAVGCGVCQLVVPSAVIADALHLDMLCWTMLCRVVACCTMLSCAWQGCVCPEHILMGVTKPLLLCCAESCMPW
jgi:hypothetical protein